MHPLSLREAHQLYFPSAGFRLQRMSSVPVPVLVVHKQRRRMPESQALQQMSAGSVRVHKPFFSAGCLDLGRCGSAKHFATFKEYRAPHTPFPHQSVTVRWNINDAIVDINPSFDIEDVQALLALTVTICFYGLTAYFAFNRKSRPRGSVLRLGFFHETCCKVVKDQESVRVIFTTGLAEGTVIGAYPGRPRAPREVQEKIDFLVKSKGTDVARNAATYMVPVYGPEYVDRKPRGPYFFRIGEITDPKKAQRTMIKFWLDPTDENGQISNKPGPGKWWLPVDSTLAYIRRPKTASDRRAINVRFTTDPSSPGVVNFGLKRDIKNPEEKFIITLRRIKKGEEVLLKDANFGKVSERKDGTLQFDNVVDTYQELYPDMVDGDVY
eukprot:jgi/Botrbrau1/22208/Bobra.168_1s0039.1